MEPAVVYATSTSSEHPGACLIVHPTGEWASAHSTISRKVSGDAIGALIFTFMRTAASPAETLSSRPRMPRLSESLSTVTSRLPRSTPSFAARIAITVAVQVAKAPRSNHPGFGPDAVPPIAGGMSVIRRSLCGPLNSHCKPAVSRAVAGAFFDRALVGSAEMAVLTFSIAARMLVTLMIGFQSSCDTTLYPPRLTWQKARPDPTPTRGTRRSRTGG